MILTSKSKRNKEDEEGANPRPSKMITARPKQAARVIGGSDASQSSLGDPSLSQVTVTSAMDSTVDAGDAPSCSQSRRLQTTASRVGKTRPHACV